MVQEIVIDSFKRNEIDANKHMIRAANFTAISLFFVWGLYGLLYITNYLIMSHASYVMINIFFPVNIALLISTQLWKKTKFFNNSGYKYFIIGTFISVFFFLNITIPKHAMITWAIPILLANHYYNPKVGRITFIVCLVTMLIALYGGMFVGEYDPNLLTSGVIKLNEETGEYFLYQPDGIKERYEMLHTLLVNGENRYSKVLSFYYFSRAVSLFIIYYVSNALSKRTYNLLTSEVNATTERQQMATELNIAHDIQHAALPNEIAQFDGATIITELLAAKDVGGDLYDYFFLDNTHLAVVIGDVSGKGVPAAMFMMKSISCFKAFATINKHPSDILREVNKALYQGNESGMFLTAFFGIIDLETGMMEYANAGHNKPIIGSAGKMYYLPCSSGFILGVLEEAIVKDEYVKLEKGDILFLYTDGITEAKNINDELYGEKRLLNFVNSKEFYTLTELHYELKDDIKSFVKGAEQADDMTYLLLKYQAEKIDVMERSFLALADDTKQVLDFVGECCDKVKAASVKNDFYIALDEIFSNIVKYAYKDRDIDNPGEAYIRFTFNQNKKEIVLTIIDKGIPFNPLEVDASAISGNEEMIEEGGLGILIVKNKMDKVSYNRINDKNILVLNRKVD